MLHSIIICIFLSLHTGMIELPRFNRKFRISIVVYISLGILILGGLVGHGVNGSLMRDRQKIARSDQSRTFTAFQNNFTFV